MSFDDFPDIVYSDIKPNDNWDLMNIYEIFTNYAGKKCYRKVFATDRVMTNKPYFSWKITNYGLYYYCDRNSMEIEELLKFDISYNLYHYDEETDKFEDDFLYDIPDIYSVKTNKKIENNYLYNQLIKNVMIYDEPEKAYNSICHWFLRIENLNNEKYEKKYVAKKMKEKYINEYTENGFYYS